MPRTVDDILSRVQDTLQATHIALDQLTGEVKEHRLYGLRNVMIHGRAVTNVLQNLRSAVGKDVFDRWYEPYQKEMQNSSEMKYLYKLRTDILKRGELELKTRVSVGIMGLLDLQAHKPPGSKSIFMDVLGGIGWIVDVGDGSEEKFYVNSSSNIDNHMYQAKIMFPHAPEETRHESVVEICNRYVQYLSYLVKEANIAFATNDSESILIRGMRLGYEGKGPEARAELSKVLDEDIHEGKYVASGHFNIGVSFMLDGDIDAEIESYTKSIDSAGPLSYIQAVSLVNRGVAFARNNQFDKAIADLSRVVEKFEFADQIAQALLTRSSMYFQINQPEYGYSDLDRLILESKFPPEVAEMACLNRGHYRKLDGDVTGSLEDYGKVATSQNVRNAALALLSKASIHHYSGHSNLAIETYDSVSQLESPPGQLIAKATINKGCILAETGDRPNAERVFTSVILDNVDRECTVLSLINRGKIRVDNGTVDDALEDYTSAIERMEFCDAQYLNALLQRSKIYQSMGKEEKALDDLSILVASAPSMDSEVIFDALVMRSHILNAVGSYQEAIDDTLYLTQKTAASCHHLSVAYINQGTAHSHLGELEQALASYKEFFAVKETESKDRIHYTADLINEVNPNLLHLKKIRTKLSKMLSDNFSDHELEKILHKVDSDRHELFIIFADTE